MHSTFQIQLFEVGDYVKIKDDLRLVKQLQKGHGEWTENTKTVSFEILYSHLTCSSLVPSWR